MHGIKVSQFLVSMIFLLLSTHITATRFSKVINEFLGYIVVRPGDVLQCEITKTYLDETNFHVLTQACTQGTQCYVYQELSEKKCFSFKVKTLKQAHIVFGNTAFVSPGNVEIVLNWDNQSLIRERGPNLELIKLIITEIKGIVSDREYRGFWVRWSDNELFEIGRENEAIPFLHYKFSRKLQINYVGILSWDVSGAWTLDRDPKCPGTPKKMRAESECMVLK